MQLPTIYPYMVFADYSDFSLALNEFCRFYEKKLGQSKNDYQTEFDKLKKAFEKLTQYLNLPADKMMPANSFFEKTKAYLNAKNFSENQIVEIADLGREFQIQHEKIFSRTFWFYSISSHKDDYYFKKGYSKELYKLVDDLFRHQQYEAAVTTAFKYLDEHLQKLLKVPPHKYYGEDLVNLAFAPNSGALQLNTHPNEQLGLRNLFSGAYAYFRNPTAHRFVEYDEFSAQSIIAMIALIAKTATLIAQKKKENKK